MYSSVLFLRLCKIEQIQKILCLISVAKLDEGADLYALLPQGVLEARWAFDGPHSAGIYPTCS